MDQVDSIIFLTLRQLGTDLPEELSSLADISTAHFVESAARCINAIQGNEEMPLSLPANMAARFRVGTTLAKACEALGYGSEIGYNTFLYSNETECRSLLMWLIERLPKDGSSSAVTESIGYKQRVLRAVSTEVNRQVNTPWVPSQFHRDGIVWTEKQSKWHFVSRNSVNSYAIKPLRTSEFPEKGTARYQYEQTYMGSLSSGLQSRQVLASIIHRNSMLLGRDKAWEKEKVDHAISSDAAATAYKKKKMQSINKTVQDKVRQGVNVDAKREVNMRQFLSQFAGIEMGKMSMFKAKSKLQFEKEPDAEAMQRATLSDEEVQKQREEEVEGLQGELDALSQQLSELGKKIGDMKAKTETMISSASTEDLGNEELEREQGVRKRVLDLLPNAGENIAALKEKIDVLSQKIVAVAEQWEEHRNNLTQEYRMLKVASENKESDARKQVEEITRIKQEAKEIMASAKEKELTYQQLVEAYEKMNKGRPRSEFTDNILKIVKNIDRQKFEITKVLGDIRSLQKDINNLSGKVKRTFTVAEEEIYREFQNNDAAKDIYRLLVSVRDGCEALRQYVEETGNVMRNVRELEDQVQVEEQKHTKELLDRINEDYKSILSENKKLSKELGK
eukprot:m.137561 g.137561  ORF g.137561 m.137561 type:complete len:620 (+) comp11909_c0_seq1:36-1895(+)